AIEAWGARLVPGSADLPGAVPPYSIPSIRIDSVRAQLPFATGYMRGGTKALTGFPTESFADEMARALNADPFTFRMGMLGGNLRLAKVLTAVTAIGGRGGGGARTP